MANHVKIVNFDLDRFIYVISKTLVILLIICKFKSKSAFYITLQAKKSYAKSSFVRYIFYMRFRGQCVQNQLKVNKNPYFSLFNYLVDKNNPFKKTISSE
jgi:hypothetical protein